MITPVIIAGGKGMRLWPASRESLPKPYVSVTGDGGTLLQSTFARLKAAGECGPPLVVCSEAHDFLVREQAAGNPVDMLLEPMGRNTAPALCAAALVLAARGSDEPMLVLPADHIVKDGQAFASAVRSGADLARQGHLVTFAITPTSPATGYGYLKIGAPIDSALQQYRLEAFVEKPDLARAEGFLAAGGYAWNSGMFMFRPSVLIGAFEQFQPEILAACRAALAAARPGPVMKLEPQSFAAAPSISIDYAIMEKAPNVATVVADLGWSDVGDWQAIWEIAPRDAEGNAVRGNAQSVGSRGSLMQSDGPLVVGIGLEDMIAVGTKDAVVVAPRARSQDVKLAVDLLNSLGRGEAASSKKVFRPWGSFEQLHIGPGFQVKELTVIPGAKLSLQSHKFRAEHWVCIAGEGIATCDGARIPLKVGEATYLPLGAIHRLENPGTETLRIIEVQIGSYTGEDDIQRYEDVYGRA